MYRPTEGWTDRQTDSVLVVQSKQLQTCSTTEAGAAEPWGLGCQLTLTVSGVGSTYGA